MKNATKLLVVLAIVIVPFQTGCAQTKPCPSNNENAEQVMKNYLSKEVNIKSLNKSYNLTLGENAPDKLRSLTGDDFKKECQQLRQHLKWLKKERNYSIYKVDDHYFIVLYSYTDENDFKFKSIPIINSNFKAVGSIIHF